MNRFVMSFSALSLLLLGCGGAPLSRAANAPEATAPKARASEPTEAPESGATTPTGDGAQAALDASKEARKPGDFIVYRFSGSFRKAPRTLTERVVAREGTILVIDMALAREGGAKDELRVRFSDAPASRGEVIAVAQVDGSVERSVGVEVYEALMAEVALAADQNEALLGAEDTTIEIGGATLPCRRTNYRVRIGKRAATMSTLESDTFAWGDLGGEITAKDGTVLYRAEIIEVGHRGVSKDGAIAQTSEE